MISRWARFGVICALLPLLMAMRPVDEKLLTAAMDGDLGKVKTLIEEGADVHAANSDRRDTAPCRGVERTPGHGGALAG